MTSEEIVRALRCTASVQHGNEPCESCPFQTVEKVSAEEAEQLHCEEWRSCDVDGVALAAAELFERLEKEKAALMKFTMENTGCDQCKHYDPSCDAVDCVFCEKECACASCKKGSKWEWKGVEE